MGSKTAIAISGGVDSLVAAYLLKEQGHNLIAVHFLTGFESHPDLNRPETTGRGRRASSADHQRRLLAPLCEQLGIPLHIFDLSAEFRTIVVEYFTSSYLAGETPNPCLVCNPLIKFHLLLEKASQQGAARLATGHYARLSSNSSGQTVLLRGADRAKDQSYFLARLKQQQLNRAMLPIGDFTKAQIRQIARKNDLKPAVAHESQDICFIKDRSYVQFLQDTTAIEDRPGPIEDINGRRLGRHQGLHRFTIGQRRGINCPAAEPYYVVRLEPQRNCLVVGHRADLAAARCRVRDINWIASIPQAPLAVQVQIRYRHKAVPAIVKPDTPTSAEVVFDVPEDAVTPGQGAVFYQGEVVLGGGWIY